LYAYNDSKEKSFKLFENKILKASLIKFSKINTEIFYLFRDRVLLCSPGWPQTYDSSASASQELGLRV
jgi:hypothetical protein